MRLHGALAYLIMFERRKMFQKRSRLNNLLHFKALLSYVLLKFAHGKPSTVCFGVAAVFSSKGFERKNRFWRRDSQRFPLFWKNCLQPWYRWHNTLQTNWWERMLGWTKKITGGLIFHANIRSRQKTSPLTTVGKIPSKSSQEKFSLIVDFLGIPGSRGPFFLLSITQNLSRMFFFADTEKIWWCQKEWI